MGGAVLTRTSSGYRAIKQAGFAGLVPSSPPAGVMAPPQFKGITPYLIYTVYIGTLGPLLFGYHLVRRRHKARATHSLTDIRVSSMHLKKLSLAKGTSSRAMSLSNLLNAFQ